MEKLPKIGEIVEIDGVKYSVEKEERPFNCKGCDLDDNNEICFKIKCDSPEAKKCVIFKKLKE